MDVGPPSPDGEARRKLDGNSEFALGRLVDGRCSYWS